MQFFTDDFLKSTVVVIGFIRDPDIISLLRDSLIRLLNEFFDFMTKGSKYRRIKLLIYLKNWVV
jgi:hypothetical protein